MSGKNELFTMHHLGTDSPLNTPSGIKLYNIENGQKKEFSDWKDASIVHQLQTNTVTGKYSRNTKQSKDFYTNRIDNHPFTSWDTNNRYSW